MPAARATPGSRSIPVQRDPDEPGPLRVLIESPIVRSWSTLRSRRMLRSELNRGRHTLRTVADINNIGAMARNGGTSGAVTDAGRDEHGGRLQNNGAAEVRAANGNDRCPQRANSVLAILSIRWNANGNTHQNRKTCHKNAIHFIEFTPANKRLPTRPGIHRPPKVSTFFESCGQRSGQRGAIGKE